MREKRSAERDDKTLTQDLFGLVLSGLGGLFTVSLFLSLLGWQPKEKLWTAPVIGLIDVLGQVPGLFFCVALAVLGTVLFLRSREVPVGRHVLGILGATVGLSLCLSKGGGAIGRAVPDVLPGKAGLILGLVIGLTVLLASVWVTWLGSAGGKRAKPGPRVPISSSEPEESEGVSAAEAAALVASLARARELPSSTPKTPAADVRLRGGVPHGARPLGYDDEPDEPQGSRAGADARPRALGPGTRAAAPVAFPAREPADEDLAAEGAGAAADDAEASALLAGKRPETLTSRAFEAPESPNALGAFEVEVKPIGRSRSEEGSTPGPVSPSWESARLETEADEAQLDFEGTLGSFAEDEALDDGEEETLVSVPSLERAELRDEVLAESPEPVVGLAVEAGDQDGSGVLEAPWTTAAFDDDFEEDEDDEDDDDDEEEDEDEDVEDPFGRGLVELDVPRAVDADEPDEEQELEPDDVAAPRPLRSAVSETVQPGLFDTEETIASADHADEARDVERDEPAPLPVEPTKKPRRRSRAKKTEQPVEERSGAAAEATSEPEYVLTPQEMPPSSARKSSGANQDDLQDLVYRAGCLILEENRVAVSMLERKFAMDFDRACEVLDRLQKQGLIGPYMGGRTRDILLSREEWMAQAP